MKKFFIFFLLMLSLGFGGILWLFKNEAKSAPDMVAINDAVMTAMQIDNQDEAMDALAAKLAREFELADSKRAKRDFDMRIFMFAYTAAFAVLGLLFYMYCEKSILAPFRKLRRFAKDVAAGNLDMPLMMDRGGAFGAFTESFDLMREELKKARENERAAERGKKELVASLSHEIKTPVASIKSAAELMLVKTKDEKERIQLERINEKAEQINLLVTDMFHSTLEELQALTVAAAEIHSTKIPQLIQNADYKNQAKPFAIPDCIVLADPVRLQQVFDNLISNSYKYAGTEIEISSDFEDGFLAIDITDFGPGAPEDELPLLFGKFYRGKNAGEKSGYGLGLYISKYLIEKMSGNLICRNRPGGGFAAKIILRLA